MTDESEQNASELLRLPPSPERDKVWERLLASVSPLLLHVCRSLGGGHDAAMDRYASVLDALQDADFRRLRTFDPERGARFTTWLAVVARRLCIEHERQRLGRIRGDRPEAPSAELLLRRRLALGISADEDVVMVAGATPGEASVHLEERERLEALAEALAHLPAADRLLLQLRYEGNYTAAELARLLSLPSPFHVYRRLRVVQARLAGLLRARGIDPS